MNKILLPVDGSPDSDAAARHVIDLAGSRPALDVLLLNVQPAADEWLARRFLKPEEVAAAMAANGEDALRSARALLDAAGVRYTALALTGPVAETIAKTAREQGCGDIVMGTRGLGAVTGILLGSVATKVIHFADVPVTLVK
ncbi:MAG: universal stress protein [Zoogloeaceae bacterium]|jgi:nucleotide-binding universal stress UspA family protein|nr:universal stress protein [Zoogloeaceae bacterium]